MTSSSFRAASMRAGSMHRSGSLHPRNKPASWRDRQQSRLTANLKALRRVLVEHPSILVYTSLALGVLLFAGIWGVQRVADSTAEGTKDRVSALATDVASWYRTQIHEAYAPVVSIAAVVHYEPNYDAVAALFTNAAPELVQLAPPNSLQSLQLAPQGVIRLAYPLEENQIVLGYDLFATEEARGAVATVRKRQLTLMGPLTFIQGGFGVRARLPVFVRNVTDTNDTFGAPDTISPTCGAPCALNATTGVKFWGFATALIELQKLHNATGSRLRAIGELGYNYELLAPAWDVSSLDGGGDGSDGGRGSSAAASRGGTVNLTRVTGSERLPADPVEAVVELQEMEWYLRIAPQEGWRPSWYAPVLVVVILVDVAFAALMFTVLASRRQHQQLLEALLPREMIDNLRRNDSGMRMGPRIMEAATTADLLLDLLAQLLEGGSPDLRDILLIREQILLNMDIYRPLNLGDQLRDANLDDDVARMLMHQLGGKFNFSSFDESEGDDEDLVMEADDEGKGVLRSGQSLAKSTTMSHHDYATISGALAMILAPQSGWHEQGPDMSDAASDAAMPTHETETATHNAAAAHRAPSVLTRAMSITARQVSGTCASTDLAAGDKVPPQQQRSGLSVTSPRGSATIDAGAEGGAHALPGSAADGERSAMSTTASAITVAMAMGNEDRRPQRSDTEHSGPAFSGIGGMTRGRRRSALLSVSIADGLAACGGGVGFANVGGKTLSNSSHLDALEHHGGGGSALGRLWAAGVSRRSITGLGLGPPVGAAMAKKPPTPPAPVIEDVERVLATADGWQFDTWRLREVTNGHPLSALGFYLIQRAGLIQRLKLKPAVVARALRHIEAGYIDNPYHSATHAADVLQTLHVIIHGAQLQVNYLDPLGLFAAYWAAIVHDFGHPGLTNDFLIGTDHPLAVRYNDRSPLENHHAAASFSSLRRPGLDVLAPLAPEQKTAFRKQVIEMVLATDMKQHFSLLSHFNTVHRLANYTNKPAAGTPGAATPLSRMNSNPAELQQVAVGPPPLPENAPRPIDDTERLLSLQIAIKAADLGHLGEALDVHRKWLAGLEEEFFLQGDKEQALGLPISPLFDRAKQGVGKSQVGFYDFVALPLVHALSSAFPGAQPLMKCFVANYNTYRAADGQGQVSEPRSGKLPGPVGSPSSRLLGASTSGA